MRSTELPPLPESISGHFAGVHGGRLIVAGGTYWDKPKWEGGEKRWTPSIYTLGPVETEWRKSGEQVEVLSYGGSATTGAGLVCVGGQTESAASTSVRLLWWEGSRIRQRRLADLPEPRMMLGAALSGDSIVAVGGQSSPLTQAAESTAWRLETVRGSWDRARWRRMPPVPGAGRILPAVAGTRTGFYLASGASLALSPAGTPRRTYLRDAFRLRPGDDWAPLPVLPAAVVAAPACCDDQGRFLIFGGDDGALADRPPSPRHPGFRRAILRLEGVVWREAGAVPLGLVTTVAVSWRGSVVIPGGEDRPGARTSRVLSIQGITT